jgi:cytochrome c oxidase assembly factor 4
MSKDDKASAAAAQLLIDDEPDDWCVQLRGLECQLSDKTRRDKRIFSTGCAGS